MVKKYYNRSISLVLIAAMLMGLLYAPSAKAEKEETAKNFTLKNPHTDAEGVSTWDCIYFGNYWQSDTNGDGIADQNDEKEPIKWRILSIDGDDAFLLADQCLNSIAYHKLLDENITWEHCTLRSWLNGYSSESNTAGVDYSGSNFIEAAFSPNEQAIIHQTELNNRDNPKMEGVGGNDTLDKIYLLSVQDVVNSKYGFLANDDIGLIYGSNTRVTTNTAYVESDYYKFFTSYRHSEPKIWMLRTQGAFDPLCVGTGGDIDSRGYDMQEWFGVRPALHMDISETALWSYAGQVSADGANPVLPTNSPRSTPNVTPDSKPTDTPTMTKTPDATSAPGADRTAAPNKPSDLEVTELEEDVINYGANSYGMCRQISCEEKNGIYFLNRNKIYLYDLDQEKSRLVHTFEYVMENQSTANILIKDSYVAGNILYVTARCYYGSFEAAVVQTYNLVEEKPGMMITLPTTSCTTVGVDPQGRIYTSDDDYIYLLNDNGVVLDKVETGFEIYSFAGFDDKTGSFYVESYANWLYWGYDHDMNVLRMGNVTNGSITIDKSYNVMLSQLYFTDRQRQLEAVDNKYIFADSTVYSSLYVFDMSNYSSSDKQGVDYSLVPTINNALLSIDRNNRNEEGEISYYDAVGTRTAYMPETESVVSYVDGSTLVEYDLNTKAMTAKVSTAHPVFSLVRYGQYIIAIEQENGKYYLEKFLWKKAENLSINIEQTELRVGENIDCQVESEGGLVEKYTWTTSDAQIASVNQNGTVTAWKEGTVTITVKTSSGASASRKITVIGNPSLKNPDENILTLSGSVTNNASANTYTVWSSVMNSYLTENADGTITRVEHINKEIILETYEKNSKKLINSATISMELELFGGLYVGQNYNYFVFGAVNASDSNDAEVMRVVKYNKKWNRISALSYYGCNTNIPFQAGCLRMTEQDGKLYVYTCHTMFTSQDGLNHQSNMTFVIDEESMSEADSYYDILNIAQAGYVSHSFNQFIQADSDYIYRVDHGDAYPRGISITACRTDGSITDVRYTIPISLDKIDGYNATGASVGGFELSTNNCLIVGNYVDDTKTSSPAAVRNIFLSVTDKNFDANEIKWLTNYTDDSVAVGTPQLVKMNEEQFLILWEEKYNQKATYTAMVTVDGAGNLTSSIIRTRYRLSDCQPICCSDGVVRWYVSDNNQVTLYQVQPLLLSQMKGIVTADDIKKEITANSSTNKNKTKTVTKKIIKKVSAKIGVPKKVKVVSKKKRCITISWKKCSGVDGYQILLAKNEKFSKGKNTITVKNAKKRMLKKRKLKSKTVYYVKIRAYKKVNGKKKYGRYSKIVKVKVK